METGCSDSVIAEVAKGVVECAALYKRLGTWEGRRQITRTGRGGVRSTYALRLEIVGF